ncbi:MAG: hypothetical protein MI725_09560 [Pirellulales bacterium]|nr:hypothetical protein [Pirellulales bacterium]
MEQGRKTLGTSEEARLVALEQGQRVHAQQIETLAETITQQGRQFQESLEKQGQELADAIGKQAEQSQHRLQELHLAVTELARPKWNTYIAAAVFCMALITASGGAALAPLYLTNNLLWKAVEKNEAAIAEHVNQQAHPAASVRLESLQQQVDNLQQEIRHKNYLSTDK